MPDSIIGRISVGDGATFTPAIDSDGVLTFSNNKNLPNPEPFDVPGAVINSGAMTPGSENGTIAFGGNDVAVTGWDTKANVASPAFTGTPTAPTPASADNTTKIATTAYVQGEKTSAIDTANDYTDEQIRQHGNLPVGYEYFTFNPSIPQGSLPLFGGEYSRDTYSDLWEWVQTQTGYLKTEAEWQTLSASNNGNVPFYSSGDGSTTFRVPSLKCWVRGANGTVSEVGSYLEAGLPNITGDVGFTTGQSAGKQYNLWPGITNGAFSPGSTGSNVSNIAVAERATTVQNAHFSAHDSNAIYGNSTTVQPESIVGLWLVKAYGVIVDTGQIDEQAYIDDRFNAMKTYVDGKFESVVASGENYVRYDSGIQVCFGTTDLINVPTNTDTSTLVTFPVPFIDNKYVVNFTTEFVNSNGWRYNSICTSGKTTTQAYLYIYITNDVYNCKFDWIAVGYWK